MLVTPNPSRDNKMFISLSNISNMSATVQLTDAAGRTVMAKQMVLGTTPQLFLPVLNKGVYILSVANENSTVNKKIVIE